ncbi:MAG: hypothetical protein ACRDP9_23070 [Kribbellaceae bacterium]
MDSGGPHTGTRRRRRPRSVVLLVCLLGFMGTSATGGGIALMADRGAAPPQEWLDRIPLVDSWLVPGLILGLGFGIGSLLTAYGMLRLPHWPLLGFAERRTGEHWSWAATILIGAGHVAWIALELVYLPELSALQVVYGGLGLALVTVPLRPAVREHLRLGI